MGKLYDLVKYRNELSDALEDLRLDSAISNRINDLKKLKIQNPLCANQVASLILQYDHLAMQEETIVSNVKLSIEQLSVDIDCMSAELFDNDIYRELFSEKHISQFSQCMKYTDAIEHTILGKITSYCDWHYPALQINPRFKKWIDSMIASDPLYLVTLDVNELKLLILEYPELYQNRLRLYKSVDRSLSLLPQNQFGFVLCWDNFNYLSIEKIKTYVEEVFKLLRPGGVFMFSYNNCELLGSAKKAEAGSNSYCDNSLLKKLFNEIGYDIIAFQNIETGDAVNPYISWAEVRKPGELSTIKTHPAQARIFTK